MAPAMHKPMRSWKKRWHRAQTAWRKKRWYLTRDVRICYSRNKKDASFVCHSELKPPTNDFIDWSTPEPLAIRGKVKALQQAGREE